jgi:hypothetical protein
MFNMFSVAKSLEKTTIYEERLCMKYPIKIYKTNCLRHYIQLRIGRPTCINIIKA